MAPKDPAVDLPVFAFRPFLFLRCSIVIKNAENRTVCGRGFWVPPPAVALWAKFFVKPTKAAETPSGRPRCFHLLLSR